MGSLPSRSSAAHAGFPAPVALRHRRTHASRGPAPHAAAPAAAAGCPRRGRRRTAGMAPMPSRKLPQGLVSSAQGFGCMSLTPFGPGMPGGCSREEGIAILRRALELGVTLFDSSDLYGPYINEELLGEAFEGVPREKYVIATKWGPMHAEGGIGHMDMDASPAAVRAKCEGALKRLRTDYIDLWILRGPTKPEQPLEDTMKALKELVEEGKVKFLGLSEMGPRDIRRCHAVHPITALEMEWSLFARDCEEDLVPVARELGIGFLAYSPLGRGMLTGTIKSAADLPANDFRRLAPRFADGNLDKARKGGQNAALAAKVGELAARKGCTPGQLALAWVQACGEDVIPIPGTKRIKYLEENVAALELKLSTADMAELEAAVPHTEVAGDRYPHMKRLTYHYEKE